MDVRIIYCPWCGERLAVVRQPDKVTKGMYGGGVVCPSCQSIWFAYGTETKVTELIHHGKVANLIVEGG